MEKKKHNPAENLRLDHDTRLWFFTIIKYGFALVMTILACTAQGFSYFFACFMELLIIMMIPDLFGKHRRIGSWLNNFLMILYNIQIVVLFFGSSFIKVVMLTNVDSIQDLSGKLISYILVGAAIAVTSLLPVHPLPFSGFKGISLFLAVDLCFTMAAGSGYSPLYAYAQLAQDASEAHARQKEIKSARVDRSKYYKKAVAGYCTDKAGQGKNVVLIFTEGLSQQIVDDSRNIMPNVASYEKQSLNFTNYYNHTFATYRGIIGQLYSGYQNENLDENHLDSLQSILSKNNYRTEFINSEPNNVQFESYLKSFNFDTLTSEMSAAKHGPTNSVSDKDLYSLLFKRMEAQHKEKDKGPFFIATYSFGTHMSFDSTDEKFSDGSSAFLNKFYNLDAQFGKFMEKFKASDMADDTIIIFTADHCTYVDNDYRSNIPEGRVFGDIDRIPLFIYNKGQKAQTIDAGGRNSLDLAPTVIDYTNLIANSANYFLGTSLFSPTQNNNTYDTFFTDGDQMICSAGGRLVPATADQEKIVQNGIKGYYTLKLQ